MVSSTTYAMCYRLSSLSVLLSNEHHNHVPLLKIAAMWPDNLGCLFSRPFTTVVFGCAFLHSIVFIHAFLRMFEMHLYHFWIDINPTNGCYHKPISLRTKSRNLYQEAKSLWNMNISVQTWSLFMILFFSNSCLVQALIRCNGFELAEFFCRH